MSRLDSNLHFTGVELIEFISKNHPGTLPLDFLNESPDIGAGHLSSLQGQVLTDKSEGHAAFAHPTRYTLDGVMARVTGREHARQAGLQRKRVTIEFSGGEVAPGADIATRIPLQFARQP